MNFFKLSLVAVVMASSLAIVSAGDPPAPNSVHQSPLETHKAMISFQGIEIAEAKQQEQLGSEKGESTLEEQHEWNVFRVKVWPVLALVVMALVLCGICKTPTGRRIIRRFKKVTITRTFRRRRAVPGSAAFSSLLNGGSVPTGPAHMQFHVLPMHQPPAQTHSMTSMHVSNNPNPMMSQFPTNMMSSMMMMPQGQQPMQQPMMTPAQSMMMADQPPMMHSMNASNNNSTTNANDLMQLIGGMMSGGQPMSSTMSAGPSGPATNGGQPQVIIMDCP